MVSQDLLNRLAENWSLVITAIPGYENIGVVVKGDLGSIESLLSTWETGDPSFAKPTEAQLLTALATVEAAIVVDDATEMVKAGAETQATAIPGFAFWPVDTGLVWLDANMGDTTIDSITSLADAKVVMKAQTVAFNALWRFVAALRDDRWPHLRDDS